MIKAYAARQAGGKFEAMEYDPGALKDGQVELEVKYCGICHSDLSMLDNEWGISSYPFVGGHEVVGVVKQVAEHVPNLKVGDLVGLGWYAHSCLHCRQCLSGNHNLCPSAEATIIGRYGGFADKVRAHWEWLVKIPQGVDPASAGPLFCGGITVFNPIIQHGIKPTAKVGVIGIGGLGHMAILFLNRWGCEVTAFSSSANKEAEARKLGAHHFLNTHDKGALASVANKFDLILNTANAALDWDAYVGALAPKGILHTVGAVSNAFGVSQVFPMIIAQKTLSASPLGSPATTADMIDFCARHRIAPVTEMFPMANLNDAMEKLRSGSPRYRLVLKA
jgi:uncharacterized zinc-type alcohol dehydrogenase-like protein